MELNKIKELIALNRTTFPNFFKTTNQEDLTLLVNTWYALFKGYDAEVVQNAFMQALTKAEFPVVPANVFAVINALKKASLATTDELFDMAVRAGREIADYYSPENGWMNIHDSRGWVNGFEIVKEIYKKLPAILREWKHSPLDLMRWYMATRGSEESYTRHDFKEIMSDRLNRREALGIGFNEEFCPEFDGLLGCMKSIDDVVGKKRISGGGNGTLA